MKALRNCPLLPISSADKKRRLRGSPANIPPSLRSGRWFISYHSTERTIPCFFFSTSLFFYVTLIFCHISRQSAAASNSHSRHSRGWTGVYLMTFDEPVAAACRELCSQYLHTQSVFIPYFCLLMMSYCYNWHQTWPLSARLCRRFWWHPINLLSHRTSSCCI